MRITVTARHCELPAELRQRARDLVARLTRVARRAEDAQVIFDADHGDSLVEVRLHRSGGRAGGRVHVASASGDDLRSALDRAVAKLRRQLDKSPQRRTRATARKAS